MSIKIAENGANVLKYNRSREWHLDNLVGFENAANWVFSCKDRLRYSRERATSVSKVGTLGHNRSQASTVFEVYMVFSWCGNSAALVSSNAIMLWQCAGMALSMSSVWISIIVWWGAAVSACEEVVLSKAAMLRSSTTQVFNYSKHDIFPRTAQGGEHTP